MLSGAMREENCEMANNSRDFHQIVGMGLNALMSLQSSFENRKWSVEK